MKKYKTNKLSKELAIKLGWSYKIDKINYRQFLYNYYMNNDKIPDDEFNIELKLSDDKTYYFQIFISPYQHKDIDTWEQIRMPNNGLKYDYSYWVDMYTGKFFKFNLTYKEN